MTPALPRAPDSQHYVGDDGFARAVDVRVSDAGALRNWARQGMFLLMGLEAGRHQGTADHLHISLPKTIRQRPRPAPGHRLDGDDGWRSG